MRSAETVALTAGNASQVFASISEENVHQKTGLQEQPSGVRSVCSSNSAAFSEILNEWILNSLDQYHRQPLPGSPSPLFGG